MRPTPVFSPASRPAWPYTAARLGLGLLLLATGLNGLVVLAGFAPLFPYQKVPFMETMIASGFLWPAKLIELGTGLLLVLNKRPRLALALEAPVAFNVLWFHWRLDPANLPMAFGLLTLLLLTAWPHRKALSEAVALLL